MAEAFVDPQMNTLRRIIAVLGFAGAALFGAAFAASYASPGLVERVASRLVEQEVDRRVQGAVDALDRSGLVAKAERISVGNAEAIARLRREIRDGLPQRIASEIAPMRDLNCECRKQTEARLGRFDELRIAELTRLNERLGLLIRTRYMQVSGQLGHEFRIFTGGNALVLLVLGCTVLLRPRANVHLLPAALVLLSATTGVAIFYVFRQDWLHTIVFSDYVGYGYLAYLALASVLLGDVLLNRARITAELLDNAFHAVGGAVLPC